MIFIREKPSEFISKCPLIDAENFYPLKLIHKTERMKKE